MRVQVSRATQGQQVPWESSSLTGDFVFRPGAAAATPQPAAAPIPAAPVADDPAAVEQAFWEAARDSASDGGAKAYLERYPEGRFAAEARAKLASLETRRGRFDGKYSGALTCVAERGIPSFSWTMTMEIRDNEASIDAQGTHQARFAGTVGEGGRLVLGGAYTSGLTSGFRLSGTLVDRYYQASGQQSTGSWSRGCEMIMFRFAD